MHAAANDTNDNNARRKAGLKWGMRNRAKIMLYDGRHELPWSLAAGKPTMEETSWKTYPSAGQKFRSFSLVCEKCGCAVRKTRTEVVKWGREHSRYGGVDYACGGVDILPHGVDFQIRRSRFFPTGNGWRRLLRRFKYIILIRGTQKSPPPDAMRKTHLIGF